MTISLGFTSGDGFAKKKKEDSKISYTNLQLQGTVTNALKNLGTKPINITYFVYVLGILYDSTGGSPLMSTKAKFDSETYPWAIKNVHKNMDYEDSHSHVNLNLILDFVVANIRRSMVLCESILEKLDIGLR
ncbi:MAG: hypothetical protein WBX01_13885 [Nitrososphaeraceae archaeon]